MKSQREQQLHKDHTSTPPIPEGRERTKSITSKLVHTTFNINSEKKNQQG